MPFSGRFLPGLGYRTTSVEFDVQERTRGRIQVVHLVSDQVCRAEYRGLFLRAAADDHAVAGGADVVLLAVVLGIQSLVKYFCGHALEGFTTVILLLLIIGSLIMLSLGDHRNLHCEDLRGGQGKTAVFHREKDQRQEKRQLKKTSHFHHSDEGETSFYEISFSSGNSLSGKRNNRRRICC